MHLANGAAQYLLTASDQDRVITALFEHSSSGSSGPFTPSVTFAPQSGSDQGEISISAASEDSTDGDDNDSLLSIQLEAIAISEITEIRVHPGIGMTRLGNSDEFFIGPEAPGYVPSPGGTGGPGPEGGCYKDSNLQIKRQAQRFRVYGYDASGNVVQELHAGSAGVSALNWRVHVRNMKAANYAFEGAFLFDPDHKRNQNIQDNMDPIDRDQLIVDPGAQTIGPQTSGPVKLIGGIFFDGDKDPQGNPYTLPEYLKFDPPQPTNNGPIPVTYSRKEGIELGQLHLDDEQRLLFVPGPGESESLTSPAVVLTNPSEFFDPPNGVDPDDPRTNQFSYFNVPGWYDDTCGGEIDATVTLADGRVLSSRDGVTCASDEGTRNAKRGGWVVSAPPKYAPYMYHVVSIMDRVYEVFPEANPNPPLVNGQPTTNGEPNTDFYRDVFPILDRATNYAWVSAEAFGPQGNAHGPGQPGNLLSEANLTAFTELPSDGSDPGKAARMGIYNIMRHAETDYPPPSGNPAIDGPPGWPPVPPNPAPGPRPAGEGHVARGNQMPKLWGSGGKPLQNLQLNINNPDQYLSLTEWQLQHMENWANGIFTVNSKPVPVPLDQVPLANQPRAMNEAALEPTIGGGFHPGIEFPYLIMYKQLFAEAFRVGQGTEPGSVAAYMSCPWQGDFWSCNTAWWPVQRPEIVVEGDGQALSTLEWFRGYDGDTPLSSSDGYDQMVRVWWQLGMVLPVPSGGDFETNQGETVFREFERDPALGQKGNQG